MTVETLPHCPICHKTGMSVMDLPARSARKQISAVFGAEVPDEIKIPDYTMLQCTGCGLVYANPMIAGGADYYGWITAQPKYSAGQRWEWGKIATALATHTGKTRVLEVGCGNGKLLQFLSANKNLALSGVDVSEPSVKLATEKGLDVRLVDFSNPDASLGEDETYDVMILSHVLEHVSDPLGVTRALASHLNAGGAIFVSVPYSPMSRELDGWDIQNLPPHHLTRWNKASLARLGLELGLELSLETAKAKSPFKRAVQDTCGRVLGNKHPGTFARMRAVLGNFKMFVDFYNRHRNREFIGTRPAGDTALAVFNKK
ncbi:MAG: class I SAM-dependent methyltransferase [Rhodospirillaceae bacterium]|nr:class I SAM-dependent methyltransferase [Rhodospirillaceae bacterium]